MPESRPIQIHRYLIEVMKKYPDGLTCGQARHDLEAAGLVSSAEQTHLDRRRRQLPGWFRIEKIRGLRWLAVGDCQ